MRMLNQKKATWKQISFVPFLLALATTSLRPSWLWSHLMADGRTTGDVGPGRGCLGKGAVFPVPRVPLSQGELSCLPPPLQEDA